MIPSCLKEEIIMSSQRKAEAATSENIVTTETSSLSDLWKKEDWLAVWIGFIIIAVGAVAVITGAFILTLQNSAPGVMEQVFLNR